MFPCESEWGRIFFDTELFRRTETRRWDSFREVREEWRSSNGEHREKKKREENGREIESIEGWRKEGEGEGGEGGATGGIVQ